MASMRCSSRPCDAGSARLETGSDLIQQRPGDIVTWDAARQHRWVHEVETQSFCVRIPRELLHVAEPRRLAQRVLAAGSPMGALASSLIKNMARVDLAQDCTRSPPSALLSCGHTCSLRWSAKKTPLPRSPRASVLARAKSHMLARLDCAGMSPPQIAAAVGASTRTLARAFAQEGTTPARWMWQQRLARARERLLTGESASVTDAALACGFSSLPHFSRAFRLAYGHPAERLLAR
jgi:AraC-like DNA-binding protein